MYGFRHLALLAVLIAFTLIALIGCAGFQPEGVYRPLNEDEQFLWDMTAECYESFGYDTSNMQPVLIQYIDGYACGEGTAGCAWSEDGYSFINIGREWAYASPGQYPDFVWTDLNVELFIHEYIHRFGDELFGDASHEGPAYIVCPQQHWNNPTKWD